VEMCENCESFENEEFYDEETDEYMLEEEPKKISKYNRHLTAEQLAEKMKRKEQRDAEDAVRRAEKIRKFNELQAERLREAALSKLLVSKYDYKNLTLVQQKEHDIV